MKLATRSYVVKRKCLSHKSCHQQKIVTSPWPSKFCCQGMETVIRNSSTKVEPDCTPMGRRQSGPPNQIPCSNIFHVTAKLTILARHNVVDIDPMVLNVLMFVHTQIVKTQWETTKMKKMKTSMSKAKKIQILRQKIIQVTMNLCKEQVFYVHQLIFYD